MPNVSVRMVDGAGKDATTDVIFRHGRGSG
jgi:hypothetical protein